MYTFILVVFLQTQPVTNVLFVSQFDTKKECMAQVEAVQEKIPKEKADDVVCLQVVKQDKIKDVSFTY